LSNPRAVAAGLKYGHKGTHTSRTMMVRELSDVLNSVPGDEASGVQYALAVIEENVTGKTTASNRRLTYQRLSELYGLDPSLPIFRILRRLWDADSDGRAQIALQCALARDPLLRATAETVLLLQPGEELMRSAMHRALADHAGDRLSDAVRDKVARNASSSWAQSGHLEGRVRKIRRRVNPTPGAVAFALWLGAAEGVGGEMLFQTPWARALDAGPGQLQDLALKAKQRGLINARIGGGVVDIDPSILDPVIRRH
jgi:hypothetical protein